MASMPWKKSEPMEERIEFALKAIRALNFRAFCHPFTVGSSGAGSLASIASSLLAGKEAFSSFRCFFSSFFFCFSSSFRRFSPE